MTIFNVGAGIEPEKYNIHILQKQQFTSVKEALEFAKSFAEGIYNHNPKRDIFDIMKEEKTDEDTALSIFKEEMKNNIIYFVEEFVEFDGKVIEILKHDGGD